MSISLANLDSWDPDAIQSVFSAATDCSIATRLTSDDLGRIVDSTPWDGEAHDAAVAANTEIRRDLNLHAREVDAVAEATKAAETQIRSIKSDWNHLQQEATAAGMSIDAQAGTVSYTQSNDPEVAAIQEQNYQVICAEIERLLTRADQADTALAAAIEGADGSKSRQDLLEALNEQWVTADNAEQAVHDALAGDQDSAARVNGVLDTITREQQAGQVPLTTEQQTVLSQLQAQQHGMSVEALQTAEGRLGEQGGMIGNSWQLMSNPKVDIPKTDLKPGAQTDLSSTSRGGIDQLPLSIQEPLRQTEFVIGQLSHGEDLAVIAGIVENGDTRFQNGTDIDRGLMGRATDLMKVTAWDPASSDAHLHFMNPLTQKLFEAGNADHIVNHELVTGVQNSLLPTMEPKEFMTYATHNEWTDNGSAISGVFDWTGDAPASEARIAGETASAYSNYVGENVSKLLSMHGYQTLGEVNPELVQGFAEGLSPYVANIAGDHNDLTEFFPSPDSGKAQGDFTMPTAKGIFSVLNTDPEAAQMFNGSVYQEIIRDQNTYARGIADGMPGAADDTNALQESHVLRALVDIGANNALDAKGVNADVRAAEAYASKSAAYDMAVKSVSAGADFTPGGPAAAFGIDALGSEMKNDIIGPPPTPTAAPSLFPEITKYDAHRLALNGLQANGVEIDLPPGFVASGEQGGVGYVRSFEEYDKDTGGGLMDLYDYNDEIELALSRLAGGPATTKIGESSDMYNHVIKYPEPWDPRHP